MTDRSAVAGLLRRFTRLLELLAAPGRAGGGLDLAVIDGVVHANLLVQVAGQSSADAVAQTRRLRDAAHELVCTAPEVYAVAVGDAAALLAVEASHGVRVRQPTVVVADETSQASAVARFEHSADPWDGLVELLASGPAGGRLRVSLVATELTAADEWTLDDNLQGAVAIADRHPHSVAGQRAQRVAATNADLATSFLAPAFVGDVQLVADEPVGELYARAVAGQLTCELDVMHLSEHADLASPTVGGRRRLVGGYELERLDGGEVAAHLASGLPGPGSRCDRRLADLMSITEASNLLRWPLPAGGPLPGLPARGTPRRLPTRPRADGPVAGRDLHGRPARLAMTQPGRHAHITGATGSGKSTLLARIGEHELAEGRQVVIVDPHQRVAAHLADVAHQHDRRALILDGSDPGSAQLAVLPPAGTVDDDALELARSRVCQALATVWPAEFTGPVWLSLASTALLALAHIPGAHPIGHVSELFTADAIAAAKRAGLPRAALARLERTLRNHDDVAGWAVSKFAAMTSPGTTRVIAPVGSGVPPETALAAYDLIAVHVGADAASTREAAMVGHLTVSTLLDAAMARDIDARAPATFLLDEAHRLSAASVERALSEGRKFGVTVAAAHQHLAQLPAELRDALADNAAVHAVFRTTADGVDRGDRAGVGARDTAALADLEALLAQPDGHGRPMSHTIRLDPLAGTSDRLSGTGSVGHTVPALTDLLAAATGQHQDEAEAGSSLLDEWRATRRRASPPSDEPASDP